MALDVAQLAFRGSDEPELYLEGIENLLKISEMVVCSLRIKTIWRVFTEK